MIPPAFVTEWREHAPWPDDEQVEQDLIMTRVLVELYEHPKIRESLAVRGGTALAKLYLNPAYRYSEDIDLVQIRAEPIGTTLDTMRDVLDPWLGPPTWRRSHARVKLIYRLGLGRDSRSRRNLKLEINTREHGSVFGIAVRTLSVDTRWFQGTSDVTTYELDELLATKLRALYQRKKGRDLFDLAVACELDEVDPRRVVQGFVEYLRRENLRVSRTELEANLSAKLADADFLGDIRNLVIGGDFYDPAEAVDRIREIFLSQLT